MLKNPSDESFESQEEDFNLLIDEEQNEVEEELNEFRKKFR